MPLMSNPGEFYLDTLSIPNRVACAILEDCPDEDITSEYLLGDTQIIATAHIYAKQEGIFCGKQILDAIATLSHLDIESRVMDGDTVTSNTLIATLKGPIKSILKVERVMLNLIQHLSGISSITRVMADVLSEFGIKLYDTRKTTSLWRDIEKMAVRAGGGYSHRCNLSDQILIKENHIAAMRRANRLEALETIIAESKHRYPDRIVGIEVRSCEDIDLLPLDDVDYIILDNFDSKDIVKAAKKCKERRYRAELEISGNVTVDTVYTYRHLPVHRISSGYITHSTSILDMSLLIQE